MSLLCVASFILNSWIFELRRTFTCAFSPVYF
uniref:Uncharacterized protein n=1 Tax=Arundo donax TaxID=35708 RepID=A0A0A9EBD2_ARUDO